MDKIIAVILAGGKSRRMGRDKVTLLFDGVPLLSLLIEKYGALFENVAVSGREGYPNSILDEFPGAGPMAGLHAAFSQTDADCVFLTAVDIPLGSPELALRLVKLCKGYDACVIRRSDGSLEPTFAAYGRGCYKAASDCLERGRYAMRELLELISVRYVDESELDGFKLDTVLTNINTPGELEKLRGSS